MAGLEYVMLRSCVPTVTELWVSFIYFEKEYILISWMYQLHLASGRRHCPSGIMDVLNQKKIKKNYKKKEKSCYSDIFLETTTLTRRRKHQKSSFSISDAFKKETVHNRRRRPIIDLIFSL
jgi:hypothetical protein